MRINKDNAKENFLMVYYKYMKNTLIIILTFLIMLGIGFWIWRQNKPEPVINDPIVNNDILAAGCYVATIDQDVYTITILSHQSDVVTGMLQFKNFQKDSSSGSFVGIYQDGILLADYSFQSEGLDSVMQVIFKKVNDGFIRGYGEMTTDNHFVDLNTVSYDESVVFIPSGCMGENGLSSKLPAGSAPATNPADVEGKTWVWQETMINDGSLIKPKKSGAFTISFGVDGRITGKTDCNSYFATYKMGSDGIISFTNIGSTKMFCEDSQEILFTGWLGQVNGYMINGDGDLILDLPYDSGSLRFIKI